MSRVYNAVMIVGIVVALSACTAPVSPEPGKPQVEASWTQLTLDESLLPTNPVQNINNRLDAHDGLPAIFVGSVMDNAKSQAVIWHPSAKGLGKPVPLDLGTTPGSAYAVASDGSRTLVSGSIWPSGVRTSFVFQSDDRSRWTRRDYPQAADDRGLLPEAIALVPSSLSAGVDEAHIIGVVNLDTGTIVNVASPAEGKPSFIVALNAIGSTAVLLVNVITSEGGSLIVSYTSTDSGATWSQAGALGGVRPGVADVVQVAGGLLAVGGTSKNNHDVPAAWSSTDGQHWITEPMPTQAFPDNDGWDSWLSSPTVSGDTAYVSATSTLDLTSKVLSRTPDGHWHLYSGLDKWLAPGVPAQIVNLGDNFLTVRQWNGNGQVGLIQPDGQFKMITNLPNSASESGSWTAAGMLDETPYLFTLKSVVETDTSWLQTSMVTPYRVDQDAVVKTDWFPPDASVMTSIYFAAAPSGDTVMLGNMLTNSSDPANGNDVVGWAFSAGEAQAATGLAGPRTEYVHDVVSTQTGWVAVGDDQATFASPSHAYGAVWTSQDGLTWQRSVGDFDVDKNADSSLDGACALPGGDLFVVGSVQNNSTGSDPLAFRLSSGTWQRVDPTGLGADVTDLSSCVNVGSAVVVQGSQGGNDHAWTTTDGKTFTPITIGADHDQVGTIREVSGGFVASGAVRTGHQNRAVVWLSTDGLTWKNVALPVEDVSLSTDVVPWGDRLLVPYISSSVQGAAVLNNLTKLLQD